MRYIGMDVAKAKLDCLLLNADGDKGKSRSVANSRTGITDFLAWIDKQHISLNELHVVMEGTGVYHEQAALALSDAGVIRAINPPPRKNLSIPFSKLFSTKRRLIFGALQCTIFGHCKSSALGHEHRMQKTGVTILGIS